MSPAAHRPNRSITADPLAAANARIDALVEELRARTDAIGDQQADALDRWQDEQEARFQVALADQRKWFAQRLAELETSRGGGAVLDDAIARARAESDRAVALLDAAAHRAIGSVESSIARLRAMTSEATGATADVVATIDAAARDARGLADQALKDVDRSVQSAIQKARAAASTIQEGFAHHAASLTSRAADVFAHSAPPAPTKLAENEARFISALRELICRAEQITGLPAADSDAPAHEAPIPWPPAPAPGSLADLVTRGQTVLQRSRQLANDLARQIYSAEEVRDSLDGTVQDASAALRGQREQLDQIQSLVAAGFETGFELDQNLTAVVVEAQIAAERLESAQGAGSHLRAAIADARRLTSTIDERLTTLRDQGQALSGVVHSLRTVVDRTEGKAA